jgi:uncharacterized protein
MRALAIVLVALALPAAAQDSLNNPWAEGGYKPIPLPEVEGTVPWDVLAAVELIMDGPDLIPEYGDEVQALDGETVTMVGWMLPLDSTGERILLSQYAPHCPFCMTAGPESFVELHSDDPIEMTLDPIVVEGRFEVLEESWEGYYYRMAGVTEVER